MLYVNSKGRAGGLKPKRIESWITAAQRIGGDVTVVVEPGEYDAYRATLRPYLGYVQVASTGGDNIGVGAARQAAFFNALNRGLLYMAHIDDDVTLVGDSRKVLTLVREHPESLYGAWEQRILRLWCNKEYDHSLTWIRSWHQLDAQARIYNMSNLESIGGFDPRLRTWEDTEVNMRWGLAGGWPAVIPKDCQQNAGGFHAPGGVSSSSGTPDERLRAAMKVINDLPGCENIIAEVPLTKGAEPGQTIKLKWDRKRFWDEVCGLKDARELGL